MTPLATTPYAFFSILARGLLLGGLAALPLAGQSVATAPAVGTPSRATTTSARSEVIELSAFEVQADPDNSYGALNSASITRFNVEMEKMPVSADIFTETFMKDIAVSSVEDVISGYSAGAGYSDGAGAGTLATQPGDRNGNFYIQIRGMNTPAMQRDSFMPVGAFGNPGSTAVGRTDNFDLERVEVINGPQALLYGGGGAGGVINVTSKQARFSRQGLRASLKGEALFRTDQFGSKRAELDIGLGGAWFAARFSFLRESTSSRRINIGGATNGQYGQFAFRFLEKTLPTTVRLSGSLTMNRRRLSTNPSLSAVGDPRNGMSLHYLLATDRTGETDPVTGARYPAGAILGGNGRLTWDNVDSFAAGVTQQEPVSNDYSSVTVETKWRDWLTTQVATGYDTYTDRRINPGFTFFAPRSGNNATDNWAGGLTPGDSWQPARTKAGRVAAVITKDLWSGRAKTQTLLGADYLRTDFAQISYVWYQADANWNILVAPGATLTTANLGRTPIAQQRWSISNGPTPYPWGDQDPARDRLTLNGVNYVRALQNPPQPSLVTAANPLGTPFTSGNYIQTKVFNKGLYGVNYTQWFGGRFNTLLGFRQGSYVSDRFNQFDGLRPRYLTIANATNFNLGVDWNISRWLHPYANFSDSVQPPYVGNRADPLGNTPGSAKGVGLEAGLKLNNTSGSLSGTLAVFQTSAKGDLYGINGSIGSAINPAGLNGSSGGGNFVAIDRKTRGVELRFTAAPTRNWRLRFSGAYNDGEIGSTRTYEQIYNDQFYANAAGQVTYRNGTVVYVNSSATTAPQATVVPATTSGAVPLTITMMSTPGATNPYFANPDLISGAISRSSAVANILLGTGNAANINANGPILTGRVSLPISELQLNKALAGVNPPGVIVATRVGDKTTGYPELSANFTSNYTFTGEHVFKGLSLGGTFSAGWRQRGYYYYATPVTAANALTLRRTLFYTPPPQQFNAIASYSRKLGRYAWNTQLNVSNVFNRYRIGLQPNATTGFNTLTGINATFYQQPRAFTWTNSLKF